MPELAEISKGLRSPWFSDTTANAENIMTANTVVCAGSEEDSRPRIKVEMSQGRIVIKASPRGVPVWVFSTVKSVGQLMVAGTAYNAGAAVDFNTAKYAIELLSSVIPYQCRAPHVFGREGGLVFSWDDLDMALCVPQPTKFYLEDWIRRCVWSDSSEIVERLGEKIRETFADPPGSWLNSAKTKLEEIRHLPAGWDQENAAPISPRIVEAAQSLAADLANWTTLPPKVVALADGTVQFEWRAGRKLLTIEVESQSSIHYLKWSSEGSSEENSLPVTARAEIADLLNWLESGLKHGETVTRPTEG